MKLFENIMKITLEKEMIFWAMKVNKNMVVGRK